MFILKAEWMQLLGYILVSATVQVSCSFFYARYHSGAISDLKEFSMSSCHTLCYIRWCLGRIVFCSSQVRVLSALPLVRLLLVGLVH